MNVQAVRRRLRFFDRPAIHAAALLAYLLSWGGAVGHVEAPRPDGGCACGDGPVLTCAGCESDQHHHHSRPLHHPGGCASCQTLLAGESPAPCIQPQAPCVEQFEHASASAPILSVLLPSSAPRAPPAV